MQEKYFWLVLSALIVLFSGICLLTIGYIYFVVLPRPMISITTPYSRITLTPSVPSGYTVSTQTANPPISLIFITPTTSTVQSSPSANDMNNTGSPDQFIRTYYTLINQRRYETTFAMLSEDFKDRRHCCNPDGSYQIEPYMDWWDSVDEVVILSVETLDWEDDSAVVEITLQYRMKDGRIVNDAHLFNLEVDSDDGSWLIDQ